MRMNGKTVLHVILFLICFIGISFFWINGNNKFWNQLKKDINAGSNNIYLKDITSYEWEMVCVLEPYSLRASNKDESQLKLLIQADNIEMYKNKIPNLNDDGMWAFVFIKDKKIVSLEKRGSGYYLYKNYNSNCLDNRNAHFSISGDKIFINE